MTNKEKVIKYCKKMTKIDTDHIDKCEDNLVKLTNPQCTFEFQGCPNNFGLNDYTGLCSIEKEAMGYKSQRAQCKRCWEIALEEEDKR